MDRGTVRLLVAGLAVLVIAVAVAANVLSRPPADQAVGIVTAIDSEGLTAVRGFTLRSADGTEQLYSIGTLENGDQFPPGHLAEHQSLATPIRVWYRTEGGERVAFRLEDAE